MTTKKPYSYTISPKERLVRISIEPGGGLRSAYNLVTEFTSDAQYEPGLDFIVDTRGGDYTPTVPDLMCLGKMIDDMKADFSGRIALVAERTGLKFVLRMMCATARAKGFKMRCFGDSEAAAEWIKADGPEPPPTD